MLFKARNADFLFLFTLLFNGLNAQKTEWKVDSFFTKLPHQTVSNSFDEGTWMNLDVSPDGKWIVFDLFGDIFKMPVSGGEAVALTQGMSYDLQPRFSPDGKHISFTSDRGGADNIWYMKADGSEVQAITNEDFRLLNNAVWMPNGNYIVARKHFTATRSLGTGEMWMYHKTGGKGYQMTTKRTDQKDVGEPCVDPSGKYLYWSEDVTSGGVFEYNKDPNNTIYAIKKLDIAKGTIETLISVNGGACRPQISPDGQTMAYISRVREKTVLHLFDMKTGESRPVYDGLSKDQQETWAIFGVYPNFNWLPDNKHLIFWSEGKIWKLNIESLELVNIPFSAQTEHTLINALNFKQAAAPEFFTSKMIRHACTSPDEKLLAFNAMGHIWLKALPDGKPYRMSEEAHFEFQPKFSSDGKELIYTTWHDLEMGSVRIYNLKKKKSRVVVSEKGFYHDAIFNGDGKKIAYRKGGGNAILGLSHGLNTGIYVADSDGENPILVSKSGEEPQFSKDGKHLFYLVNRGLNKQLFKTDLTGSFHRELYTSTYANQMVISPEEDFIAFKELFQVYVTPFVQSGKSQVIASSNKALPLKQVSQYGGDNMQWSLDNKRLFFTMGSKYYTVSTDQIFDAQLEWKADTQAIDIKLEHKADRNHIKYILTDARIIVGNEENAVIERGNVYVNGNRIEKVEASNKKAFPKDYQIVNCEGKTLMPGMVDVHAHLWYSGNGISPMQQWSYLANLAYGVTTTHDPSAPSEMVFSQSEMVKAGIMKGPRIFSTGTILYGADGDFKAVINSLDDARKHLYRLNSYGAFSVKSYNQPRRNQRQQVILAANELKMHVYPEGGSTFYHNMTQVVDGHTGIEHSIPVNPAFNDVLSLWSQSGVGYTPTLIVGYGGVWGENYWYQKHNVWENEKLLTWTPRAVVDTRSRRRTIYPEEEFGHITNAKTCFDIMNSGTKVQLGAHGQLQGLGAHWELWMLTQGGFSALDAIKAATLWGAEYLGMGQDLGSIEEGKLADIIVLNNNPLDDIYHSQDINLTIANGRIYRAKDLNEIHTGNYVPMPFWFNSSTSGNLFNWHQYQHSGLEGGCSCFGTH